MNLGTASCVQSSHPMVSHQPNACWCNSDIEHNWHPFQLSQDMPWLWRIGKKGNECQRYKITGKQNYCMIPLTPTLWDKEPWQVVHVNCMGLWTVNFENKITKEILQIKLDTLTVANTCLCWAEFAISANKTAWLTPKLFDKIWPYCYPQPEK